MRNRAFKDRRYLVATVFPQDRTMFIARTIDRQTERLFKTGLHRGLKSMDVMMRCRDDAREFNVAKRPPPFEMMSSVGILLVEPIDERMLPAFRGAVDGKFCV